jgi:hypothetical protein
MAKRPIAPPSSEAVRIGNLITYLAANPTCIKSASKEEIICTIDGMEFRIGRSHSFYDGGRFRFFIGSNDQRVYSHDYGMERFPEHEFGQMVDKLFSVVLSLFFDVREKRQTDLQKWFISKF